MFAQAMRSTIAETPASQSETLAPSGTSSGPRAAMIGPAITVGSESSHGRSFLQDCTRRR
jgi:hypothetical protein